MQERVKAWLDRYSHMKFYPYAKQLFIQLKNNSVSDSGAMLAYYLLLSLFPFFIFLLSLLRFTPLSDLNLYESVINNLPFELSPLLNAFLRELFSLSNDTITIIAIVFATYSASKAISGLIRAMNKAYDVKETRNIVIKTILSILLTIFLATSMILMLLLIVFGNLIINKLFVFLNISEYFYWVSHLLRIVIPVVSMYLVYSVLYLIGANRKIKFRYSIPGSVFATLGSILGSMIFGFYVNTFASYNITYGSLGGIVVFLIWINVIATIMIIGAEINGVYLRVSEK